MKPTVLITSSFQPLIGKPGVLRTLNDLYARCVIKAGALPVIASGGDPAEYAAQFDGFLFSGGGDLAPALFGEKKYNETVEVDEIRDREEIALFLQAIALKKPVLGICRGIQLINVALGGSLWQDLPAQCPSALNHQGGSLHPVTSLKNTVIRDILIDEFTVNSFHHQAVRVCGDGLFPAAYSSDGMIEAVEHRSLPVLGVQWHPERMTEPNSGEYGSMLPLFTYFIGLCGK